MAANGSAKLNNADANTGLPSQMTDAWLNYIANTKLNGLGGLKQQTADAIIANLNNGKIKKYVAAIDKSTKEINFLKLGTF